MRNIDCINEEIHASQYLAERAKEGNLNLICLGPLTNIALAMCLNPEFHEKVDSIFIMGGTVDGKGKILNSLIEFYSFYINLESFSFSLKLHFLSNN